MNAELIRGYTKFKKKIIVRVGFEVVIYRNAGGGGNSIAKSRSDPVRSSQKVD